MKTALTLVLLAACVSVIPAASAQEKKIPRIGYVGVVEIPEREEAFRTGLREHGYAVGRTVQIEYRFSRGGAKPITELAAELDRLGVDVFIASGAQALDAISRVTKIVPIVGVPVSTDPTLGYVASLGRPGGNITGLGSLYPETAGKRLELVKEMMPRLSRVAVFVNPGNPSARLTATETRAAAERLGIQVKILEVGSSDELEPALLAAAKYKPGALHATPDNLLSSLRGRIIDFATKNRIPTFFGGSELLEAGGLMSYGASLVDMHRRAATYVDKILKGAKPAELPVEQPTKFELVINLKTARQLGLAIPKEMLFRADRVIE
jgi:ABC-type uncharacterized transport system substrate-binding protein